MVKSFREHTPPDPEPLIIAMRCQPGNLQGRVLPEMITLFPVTFFNSSYFNTVIDEREIPDKISLSENQPRNKNKIVLIIESIVFREIHQVRVQMNETRIHHDRHSAEQTGVLQKGWGRSY